MGLPGAIKKTIKNNFFIKKIFKLIKNVRKILFLLQKDFDFSHVLLFGVFLCVFDNIYLPFLYIEKKL